MAVHITSKSHLDEQLSAAGGTLVVIDFHAVWCGPCKLIAPKLEQLAQEDAGVKVFKIDVDECQELAEEYGISSMPTFVFLKEGKRLEEFSGANYDKLKSTIDRLK